MEAEAFLLGHWKNFEDLEDSLSMEQLHAVLEAAREKDWEHKKFLAAIKGINLDGKEEKVDKVQEIKDRIAARESGMSPDEYEWKQAGLGFEPDEEE